MNTKSLNYSLMFSALFLLGLAGIFSYGYMGYKANVINNDTLNAEILNPENILNITGDTNFSLIIDADHLSIVNATNDETNYIDNTKNVTINLTVDKEKYKSAITCDYEIYYEPTVEYTNSAEVGNLIELGFAGECTQCATNQNKFGPISISGVKQGAQASLYKGSITTDASTGAATQTWALHYRFYNLDIDQSSVINKQPSGKVVIKGNECRAAHTG